MVILVGAFALAAHPTRAHAQYPITTQVPQTGLSPDRRIPENEPYASQEIQERQLKRLRLEHQQQLIDDTTRLLSLATALKAEVDQGTQPATLPTDALKQADEISKLAKRVSERIKTQ
jgi:hypothetical protein